MDGAQLHAFRESVKCNLPVPLLGVLLGAPQGSPFLEAPSPKGSLDGEESEGAAGAPHASSVPPGAAAKREIEQAQGQSLAQSLCYFPNKLFITQKRKDDTFKNLSFNSPTK